VERIGEEGGSCCRQSGSPGDDSTSSAGVVRWRRCRVHRRWRAVRSTSDLSGWKRGVDSYVPTPKRELASRYDAQIRGVFGITVGVATVR